MPGAIQVSVLGLMDLPPSVQSSSTSSSEECLSGLVSLKIAMGKTEYRTGGKGDFSFPVTSLSENLKLTLHNADGNEISRTDVKTMVVVEKRFWDALFPLEGGGCVHLKLQFILNAEEQKRISEMREAVLKRRHGELLKRVLKDSVAENTMRFSANSIAEEGQLADQLPLKSQDRRGKRLVASLPLGFQQQHQHHHEQDDICQSEENEETSGAQVIHQSVANEETLATQVNQIDIHEISASEETLDPKLGRSGSLGSGEITATSSSPFAMAQEEIKFSTSKKSMHEEFPVSGIKKMITAFENILVQEPRIHVGPAIDSRMRREKSGGSLGAPWLEEMNKVTIQKALPKSFSTGALPQMKWAPYNLMYAKSQEENRSDLAIDKKIKGNNKQFTELKNVPNHEKLDPGNMNAVGKSLYATESPSCERTNDTLEIIETKEVVTFSRSTDIIKIVDQSPSHEAKESPTVMFQPREHEAFEEKVGLGSFPEGVPFQDSEISNGNSDATASHYLEKVWNMLGSKDQLLHKICRGKDEMFGSPSVCGQHPGGYLESPDGRELVHTKETGKDEEAFAKMVAEPAITEQLRSSSADQGQPRPSIVKAGDWFGGIKDNVYELTACGGSDVKLDVLTYFDAELFLFGGPIPRHLCITSGSKQLKDFIGGFTFI